MLTFMILLVAPPLHFVICEPDLAGYVSTTIQSGTRTRCERGWRHETSDPLGCGPSRCWGSSSAFRGTTYTTREKVIHLGPFTASVEKKKTFSLSPIVGVLVLAGGTVLIYIGTRKS